MIDLRDELHQMNRMFQANKSLENDGFKKPIHFSSFDPLVKIYDLMPRLYETGTVEYAYIVQHRAALKHRFPIFDVAVDVIVSAHEYYRRNPFELLDIAFQILKNRNNEGVTDVVKRAVRAMDNELDRLFHLLLPLELTYDIEVYFSTVLLHRNHLPKRKITSLILPVICDLENCGYVAILPEVYWTKRFKEYEDKN